MGESELTFSLCRYDSHSQSASGTWGFFKPQWPRLSLSRSISVRGANSWKDQSKLTSHSASLLYHAFCLVPRVSRLSPMALITVNTCYQDRFWAQHSAELWLNLARIFRYSFLEAPSSIATPSYFQIWSARWCLHLGF